MPTNTVFCPLDAGNIPGRVWRLLACGVCCLLVAVLWSCLDLDQETGRQWISRALWLPLAVAAACFGLRGGLALATAGSLALVALYGPRTGWPQIMELTMMWALGLMAGWLVERHRGSEARQRANQRFTELGRATTSVSHELKNPLSIIGGYSEILASDPSLKPRQTQQLKIILGQVERMRGLLDEVREYALPLELKTRLLDLHEVALEVLELMGPASRRARVRLVDEPWPPAPRVVADPGRLQELLGNLVQNALQASRPGGQVWLITRAEGDWGMLEVVDQGEGLTREEASRIFQPFYTTKKEGTGLGLPICQRIAEAHHGRLELSGSPGKGATARLSLPLAPAEDA
ncbi:MAG: HAMP domain-containing histidine kinase [Desulfarculaceae bacterium]|nr:HAMP domain-containing histidine kinase [Desulfarculaceae bacterium]MCF8074481.1 HAMP domain-containing histidine kinase [Desulfarculaceae bacterium]MCF8103677.1 HAMP domain-containing histidine kinase [Desulfarculaceae bacterium]MCF8118005.1 HAMP domain-containing histidine kinase [Desulfarculaceae bacterium]